MNNEYIIQIIEGNIRKKKTNRLIEAEIYKTNTIYKNEKIQHYEQSFPRTSKPNGPPPIYPYRPRNKIKLIRKKPALYKLRESKRQNELA